MPLPDFKTGQTLTARMLQAIVRALLTRITGCYPILVQPLGTDQIAIRLAPQPTAGGYRPQAEIPPAVWLPYEGS